MKIIQWTEEEETVLKWMERRKLPLKVMQFHLPNKSKESILNACISMKDKRKA